MRLKRKTVLLTVDTKLSNHSLSRYVRYVVDDSEIVVVGRPYVNKCEEPPPAKKSLVKKSPKARRPA